MNVMPPDDVADQEAREIAIDWVAFAELPTWEKESFIKTCEQLENTNWLARCSGADRLAEWASIDLGNYHGYNEFEKHLKKAGAAFYERRKAEKRDYYTQFFQRQTFIADIVSINTSAPIRQGRPMDRPYLKTVEQLGGYPNKKLPRIVPTQNIHWAQLFGTFRSLDGHRQGDLVVDEQLLSYMVVRRIGNFAFYGTIIGHQDRLGEGIVYKMHHDFIKTVLEARSNAAAGAQHDASLLDLRYICYAGFSATYTGLARWKKVNLFQPRRFYLDYGPAVASLRKG